MAIPYPLINGVRHSWSSIEIRVAGLIVLGITEVNYSPSLEPGEVRGAGPRVIAHTLGQATLEGDFTILLEEYKALKAALGADSFMTKVFDIIVTYDEEGSGLSTVVDTLVGCRISKIEASNSSGSTDASTRKCTIKYLDLLDDGVSPLPPQPTIPQ